MPTKHDIHEKHDHKHGPDCGHTAVRHQNHTDYLHDGHLHSAHEGHFDEHTLEVSATNPDLCTPVHACSGHPSNHKHGPDCGHEVVPHGEHQDYLVDGHLHHAHGTHCDSHGSVTA